MEQVEPWFQEGLRFKCTGCGKCCTGSGGYVFLSPLDIDRLASHFDLSSESFMKQYTRMVEDRSALLDKAGSDACIFLKDNQCSVYHARPVQCRTFPWWIQNLQDPEDWEKASHHCEGINHEAAPIIPSTEISEQCMTYLDNLVEQHFS